MAVVQGTGGFQGLDISEVRPGQRRRMLQQLKTVHEDQCELFERITGIKVPNAGTISATPHAHDGSDSVVLPLPLAHGHLAASCPAANVSMAAAFAPLVYPCFYAPPGVDKVRVSVFAPLGEAQMVDGDLLASTHDASFSYHAEDQVFRRVPRVAGVTNELICDIDVEAGAVNILRLDLWDGEYRRGSESITQTDRTVQDFLVRPKVGTSARVHPYSPSATATNPLLVPDATYHLGTDAFISIPEEMFTDYRSVNSFLTTAVMSNAALLIELLTSKVPAPNSASSAAGLNHKIWGGHNHKGDGGSDLDDSGDELGFALGSWTYGVGRKAPGAATGHYDVDDVGNSWIGRLYGPAIAGGGSTDTYYGIARHFFRLHDILNASKYDSSGGSTTKLKAAVWLDNDQGKTGGMTVECRLESQDGGSAGTPVEVATSTDGKQLLTFDDMDAADAGSDVNVQALRVRMKQANAPGAGQVVYSSCVWATP